MILFPSHRQTASGVIVLPEPMQESSSRPSLPAFAHQDCAQTLEEGIAEYFSLHPARARGRGLSPRAAEFFRCHDAVHVVYGCGDALDDEAVVKIASIAGTTCGMGVLRGYRLRESLEIYRRLRVLDVLGSIARSVYLMPRTLWRCSRQRRRWPWDEFGPYLKTPLGEIRKEFGIRVAHMAVAVCVAVGAFLASPGVAADAITNPGDYRFTMQHGGLARACRLHVPARYDPAPPAPLLVALHGGAAAWITRPTMPFMASSPRRSATALSPFSRWV